MKTLAGILCIAVVFVLQWTIILNFSPKERLVDCGMASFHPDYTQAMRDACRKLTKGN